LAIGLAIAGLVAAILVHRTYLRPALYTLTVVPSYGGEPFRPHAMNDHGQIVGLVADGQGRYRVALWDREVGVQELDIASDGPLAINNSGQIAGAMIDPNVGTCAFLWDPQAGLTRLGPRDIREKSAIAINDAAQVVGSHHENSLWPCAFVWDRAHGVRPLNVPGARGSRAEGINDFGQVIGFCDEGGLLRPCTWDLTDTNVVEKMPSLGEHAAYADLNNHGYALGDKVRLREKRKYALLFHREKGLTWLFPLRDLNAVAYHVNDVNQVVYSETQRSSLEHWSPRLFPPRQRTLLWDPTRGDVPLDHHVRLRSKERFLVQDLNNNGCLLGTVRTSQGALKRTVLLRPIPQRWAR
jgi:uncharacterized membrane protein